MVNDAGNVFSGAPQATGGVLYNAVNTGKPTTAVSTLTGWIAAGYVSEDGVSRDESRDFSKIKEWGGGVVKQSQTEFGEELTFAFLEYLNPEPAKLIYGDTAVTTSAATSTHGAQMVISVKGTEAPHHAYLIDMFDGDKRVRLYIGDGQITSTDTIEYKKDGGALRSVTIAAYPDANGDYIVELTDDGRTTA